MGTQNRNGGDVSAARGQQSAGTRTMIYMQDRRALNPHVEAQQLVERKLAVRGGEGNIMGSIGTQNCPN